jgi:hypothetical protein
MRVVLTGYTVDGRYLVAGVQVTPAAFFRHRAAAVEEARQLAWQTGTSVPAFRFAAGGPVPVLAPLRCAPGTLASEPAQATDVQAREYAY